MLIIITGATGTGKSEVAIELAKLIDGEIISADSMQVYRGMDVGTNKMPVEQRGGIEHYLIDVADPKEDYSAARFKKEAEAAIAEIEKKGMTPIICGGTGLYIDALIKGLFEAPPVSGQIKEKVEQIYGRDGKEGLLKIIEKKDPETAAAIDVNNPRRLIRALEVILSEGGKFSDLKKKSGENAYKGEYEMFILKFADREKLYARLNNRAKLMFEKGLIAETENLLKNNPGEKATAMQAIGYKETADYMKGRTDKAAALEKIKQATRNYAKRQETWFKRYKKAEIIDVDLLTSSEIALKIKEKMAKIQGEK
jgi:tRNA dimethylallyltransferase